MFVFIRYWKCLFAWGMSKFLRLMAIGDSVDKVHHKLMGDRPHWYLAIVGVDPDRQGQGLGTKILRPVLEQADREQREAYLECSNPVNIPFYEKLGFEIRETRPCSDWNKESPVLYYMIRPPQTPSSSKQ